MAQPYHRMIKDLPRLYLGLSRHDKIRMHQLRTPTGSLALGFFGALAYGTQCLLITEVSTAKSDVASDHACSLVNSWRPRYEYTARQKS